MPAKEIMVPKISTANTKKEMLEAFKKLKEQIKAQAQAELKPEKKKKEKVEKEIIEVADSLSTNTVIQQVNSIKVEIGKALTDISGKLETETARYDKIKLAIEVKHSELEELFEIERSAHTLAALLETQKLKRLEFEQEIAEREKALEEVIAETKAEWEKEKQQYSESFKEKKEKREKAWRREMEEHEYHFNREKEQKTQALKDAIANLEKELDRKKDNAEKELAQKEADLLDRDMAVSEREKTMNDLEKQVHAFPAELDAAVTKTVKESVDRMKAEAKTNEVLLRKGFEGEKNVLTTKIESLEEVVAAQKMQIDTLTRQIDNAYTKVQDIAVQAVSGSQGRANTVNELKSVKTAPEPS